jgi:hypothetical protein
LVPYFRDRNKHKQERGFAGDIFICLGFKPGSRHHNSVLEQAKDAFAFVF